MQKRNDAIFRYPPNLHQLDLATLVTLYRNRGEPVRANPGEWFGCAWTHRLVKEAKHWFGLNYSQPAWDELLTKNCQGYPLTEVEMHVLGMATGMGDHPMERAYIEQQCGAHSQLAFLVVNDLKSFGFLAEDETSRLRITTAGDLALQGVARRLYEKKFMPEMLPMFREKPAASEKPDSQIDLF